MGMPGVVAMVGANAFPGAKFVAGHDLEIEVQSAANLQIGECCHGNLKIPAPVALGSTITHSEAIFVNSQVP